MLLRVRNHYGRDSSLMHVDCPVYSKTIRIPVNNLFICFVIA
jgi:hypothetical protein